MWPDIHLEAINKLASQLLSSADPTDYDETKAFKSDIVGLIEQLSGVITTIEGQLSQRPGKEPGDKDWRRRAKIARQHYVDRRKAAQARLKTVNMILHNADKQAARLHHQKARVERIREANKQERYWNIKFRQVLRRELGENRLNQLIEITNKETQQQP